MQAKDIMTSPVITISEFVNTSAVDLLAEASHIRHIPVTNAKGKLVGILSIRDILRAMGDLRTGTFIPVNEIMTRDVYTVAPETDIVEIATTMQERNISAVPVLEKGELVGIVTERDFLKVICD